MIFVLSSSALLCVQIRPLVRALHTIFASFNVYALSIRYHVWLFIKQWIFMLFWWKLYTLINANSNWISEGFYFLILSGKFTESSSSSDEKMLNSCKNLNSARYNLCCLRGFICAPVRVLLHMVVCVFYINPALVCMRGGMQKRQAQTRRPPSAIRVGSSNAPSPLHFFYFSLFAPQLQR